jgi:hypothetical protein
MGAKMSGTLDNWPNYYALSLVICAKCSDAEAQKLARKATNIFLEKSPLSICDDPRVTGHNIDIEIRYPKIGVQI